MARLTWATIIAGIGRSAGAGRSAAGRAFGGRAFGRRAFGRRAGGPNFGRAGAVFAASGVLCAGILCAGILCVGGSGSARAAEPQTLIVGVEELDYYPNYAVRDGRYVGAARDILDAFAESAGYRLDYRPLPVKRLYADLFAGAVDLKFPDSPEWNAAGKQGQSVVYGKPVLSYIDGVMVHPTRLGRGLDGFATLGTLSGFTPYAWLDAIAGGAVHVSENPQLGGLLRQTLTGRVDGAYVNVASAREYMRSSMGTPDRLAFDAALPHSAGDYRVSSIRRGDVLAALDAWLSANESFVVSIKTKYGLDQ